MEPTGRADTLISVNRAMGRRLFTDSAFRRFMSVWGVSVIVAVSAVFFALASVVVPLVLPLCSENQMRVPGPGPPPPSTVGSVPPCLRRRSAASASRNHLVTR